MSGDINNLAKDIYSFNIICEAKIRVLVAMTKKFHPDWTNKEIECFLKGSVEYAIKKELIEKEEVTKP